MPFSDFGPACQLGEAQLLVVRFREWRLNKNYRSSTAAILDYKKKSVCSARLGAPKIYPIDLHAWVSELAGRRLSANKYFDGLRHLPPGHVSQTGGLIGRLPLESPTVSVECCLDVRLIVGLNANSETTRLQNPNNRILIVATAIGLL